MPIPVAAVNNFVRTEGERVRHFFGMRCPCTDELGQPDPNCDMHELGGWFYPEEQNIIGLVTGISSHKEWLQAGVALPGDCVFSPLSQDTVSCGDKIIFTWPLAFGQGDPLLRGATASDTLFYPGVKSIYCMDINRVKYTEGVDFRINGRSIEWSWTGKPLAGKAPELGVKYTVKYMAYIEWIALDPPTTRISAGQNFGDKVLLRKKHLYEQ
jgi:hypothetical protein